MKKIVAIVIAFLILFCGIDASGMDIKREDEAPYRFYDICGDQLDRGLSMYLQERLAQEDIEWFFIYAICQAHQESSFDQYQLTAYSEGYDCGLFQFRDKYWADYCRECGEPENTDILDAKAQIRIYVKLASKRIKAGESVEKVISDWTTGGYTDRICEEYVEDVLSWMAYIREVR